MKNLLKVLALGLALFFIGCGDDNGKKTAANAPEASKEVVYKVGSSADYPPFEYLDEKNQKSFSFWKTASDYLANKSSSIDRMYAGQ
mgnify:CR=1 FL=1